RVKTRSWSFGSDSIRTENALVERGADPPAAAPDRMAAADEMVGLDRQHEGWRHADGVCEVERGAALRQIADRAIKVDAVEGDGCTLQYPVPWCSASLDHVTNPKNRFDIAGTD